MEVLILFLEHGQLDARRRKRLRSLKREGSSTVDSIPYLKDLGVTITENTHPIQFTSNINEKIHRWAPYVQGFSAASVQSVFDKYKCDYGKPSILDPFAGCGSYHTLALKSDGSIVAWDKNTESECDVPEGSEKRKENFLRAC